VKHIKRISKELPARADELQFIICEVSRVWSDLLAFKGGTSPLLGFVNMKCDYLSEPSEQS